MPTRKITNFGRNVEFTPEAIYRPNSVSELLRVMEQHRGMEIRAIGTLHSWSSAQKTTGILLELQDLNDIKIEQDVETIVVNVGPGCKIKDLIKRLSADRLTLPSVGLIDEQSVAGATATGTHGSGKNSLSHYLESVSIAHYDYKSGKAKVTIVDAGDDLKAARCSLGLMGIVVSLRFRCRQCYHVEEHAAVYRSLDSVLDQEPMYPQQQFYLMPWSWSYFAHHRVEVQKPVSRLAPLYQAYWYGAVDVGLHLVICTLAKFLRFRWLLKFFYRRILPLAIIRNWHVVQDSRDALLMEHELFRHIEMEVFVQRSRLKDATEFLMDVITAFGDRNFELPRLTETKLREVGYLEALQQRRGSYLHHYPIAFRRIVPDASLISMASTEGCAHEDWYSISLISYHRRNDRDGFFAFADFVGPAFAQLFGGRCHWGKYNPLDKEMNDKLYPKINQFRDIVRRYDPEKVFANEWLREVLE